MKNLFRKKLNKERWIAIYVAILLVFLPFITKAEEDTPNNNSDESIEYCTNYYLVWEDTNQPVDPSNSDDFITIPAPIKTDYTATDDKEPSPSISGFSDDLVSASSTHKGEGVKWECKDKSETPSGLSSNISGTEECEAAVIIARKYGAYTALGDPQSALGNFIKESILNKILQSLTINVKSALGDIKLTDLFGFESSTAEDINNAIKGFKDIASGDISGALENFGVTNFLKDETKKAADDIKKQAQEELNKIARKYGGKLVEQGKKILGVEGGGGLPISSEVPVNDATTREELKNELKQVQSKQDIALQEEKIKQTIEATRVRCHLLLQQTVQSIKSSLLYEFTTKTVDWIEGGGIQIKDGKVIFDSPQYIKNPGKFLERTARGAIDRWLSSVTPQLCQPFRMQVMLEIPSTARETNPYYEPYLSCTLDRVISNIQNFYNDFRSGGWIGYREILMPQNNYYGASLIASQRATEVAEAALSEARDQINRNEGFKDTIKCTKWKKYKLATDEDGNPITAEGCNATLSAVGDVRVSINNNYCYVLDTDGDSNGYVEEKKEETQDKKTVGTGYPADLENIPEGITAASFVGDEIFLKNGNEEDAGFFYSCENKEITQPATVAKTLTQQTTEADINSIINAQDLTNIEEIIQNAIINKITKVGVGGIKNLLSKLPLWTNNIEVLESIKNFGR